jgi:hypothetical protein
MVKVHAGDASYVEAWIEGLWSKAALGKKYETLSEK